jgi:hypothetical protein
VATLPALLLLVWIARHGAPEQDRQAAQALVR